MSKAVKAIYLDEMSDVEQMLYKAIQSHINLERAHGVAIRDLYLQPELFTIYEGIRNRCMDRVEAKVGYVFDGVHIKKGSIVQSEPLKSGVPWAKNYEARQRQRENLKMIALN